MSLMLRNFFPLIFVFAFFGLRAQEPDSVLLKYQNIPEVIADKDYAKKYQDALRRLRRVYPLALYAAKELQALDDELDEANKKRQKKKLIKAVNQGLKTEFSYAVRDLYIEEGRLLMKLIHRETGMTVAEIITKYRSGFRAEVNEKLGKLWGQDLDKRYDAKGEDWIVERVIQDIWEKKVSVDLEVTKMDKSQFKENQKTYRINRKKAKKAMRAKRKAGSL